MCRIRFTLVLTILACASSLLGQGTTFGTIRGTVTDATGAVVPGAKVVITDLTTNLTTELITNGQGDYEAPELKFGSYRVLVSHPGFNNTEIVDVVITGGEARRVV